MPDIFTGAQHASSRDRDREHLRERWEADIEVMLSAIKGQTILTLMDLESAFTGRRFGYEAEACKQIADYAADLAGTTLNLLGDLHGTFLQEADEAGLAHDLFPFDTSDLQAAFETWEVRSRARP